jgi:hypothetical protein
LQTPKFHPRYLRRIPTNYRQQETLAAGILVTKQDTEGAESEYK